MLEWLREHQKQAVGLLNATVAIAALAFIIMQNDDSISPTGLAGMRLTGFIGIALPQITRLREARLVEDKIQKYAANLASALLSASLVTTAYSWGAALSTAELACVGVTAIVNGLFEKVVPKSKVVAELLRELDDLKQVNSVLMPGNIEAIEATLTEAQNRLRKKFSHTIVPTPVQISHTAPRAHKARKSRKKLGSQSHSPVRPFHQHAHHTTQVAPSRAPR